MQKPQTFNAVIAQRVFFEKKLTLAVIYSQQFTKDKHSLISDHRHKPSKLQR